MRKVIAIFTLILLFIGSLSLAKTYAAEEQPSVIPTDWEDEYSPLSFQVQILPWDMVKILLPNRSYFTIIDVETGLSFRVQRRAGSRHADVQPLTIKDTAIMKQIYGGKWSWNRRAILVMSKDRLIAASMSGMPHGSGALKNGFHGHFCVHFAGSRTHRSMSLDFAHQIMVLKAAGKLDEFISIANPKEIIQLLIVAINHHDEKLLKQIVAKYESYENFLKYVSTIERIKIDRFNEMETRGGLVLLETTVKANIIYQGNINEKRTIPFMITRDSLTDQWKIEPSSFLP